MKNIVVHGAGLVGRIIAFDLCEKYRVTVVDSDTKRLASLKVLAPKVRTIEADLSTQGGLNATIDDADLVIGALPPAIGFQTLRYVIEAGKNTVQVSTILDDARDLDALAKQRGVTAVIDAGVAPGIPNLILGHHSQESKVEEYECLFGALPTSFQSPLYHRDHYPVREVLGEYLHPATAIDQGSAMIHSPLNDAERVDFPGLGPLEAIYFNGLGSLKDTMQSKIQKMSHKMLRFPQHLDFIRSLNASGFLGNELLQLQDTSHIKPIDVTAHLLAPFMRLDKNESDWIAMRITITNARERFVYHLLDRYDDDTQFSAMSRTTGYTCTSIARLIMNGVVTKTGVLFPERIGMKPDCFSRFMADLNARGVMFDVKNTTLRDDSTATIPEHAGASDSLGGALN